jgi:hypothetical protein
MKVHSNHWTCFVLLAFVLFGCTFGPEHSWAYIGTLEPPVSAGGQKDEPHLIVGVPNGKRDFNWHAPSFYRNADFFEVYYRQSSNGNNLDIVRVRFQSNLKSEEIVVSNSSKLSISDCTAIVELLFKDETPISSVNGTYDLSPYGCKKKLA